MGSVSTVEFQFEALGDHFGAYYDDPSVLIDHADGGGERLIEESRSESDGPS